MGNGRFVPVAVLLLLELLTQVYLARISIEYPPSKRAASFD